MCLIFWKYIFYWAEPHVHRYRSLSMEKVSAWCALSRNAIIELQWFQDADGWPVTVNTDWYNELWRRKFILLISSANRGVDVDTVVYPQNGATSHCCYASLEYLHRYSHGSLEKGSSTVVRTTLDLNILQVYPFELFSAGIRKKTRSMLTTPKLLMRSTITFEMKFGKLPMRWWTGSLLGPNLIIWLYFSKNMILYDQTKMAELELATTVQRSITSENRHKRW